uniref:Myosin motor domain-containing protein n=1 Tax=Lactuca sativa TaxID=4236 RepID=A0A9R1XJC2_LACSA|nr:hypothetical protein LSAT_V11C400204750 [Lactuca sativa]
MTRNKQLFSIKSRANTRNKGLVKTAPEAPGSWPIIGHLYLLCSSQVPHKLLGSMDHNFGPIFTIKLGVNRVLVVSNSEMAKECLTTNDRGFATRPKSMASELSRSIWKCKNKIFGAAIRTYLLERSRVVQITDLERNYHCFYQLCASGRDADMYNLGPPSNFHYLNQTKVYELEGISRADEYVKTRRATNIVGISNAEQEAIFWIMATHTLKINYQILAAIRICSNLSVTF